MIPVSFSLFLVVLFLLLFYVIIYFYKNYFFTIILFYFIYFFMKIILFFHVPGCSGMFRNVRHVPECYVFRVLSTPCHKDGFQVP